ncbi:unnamed protein product [Menidia menidia]|uniref:(Atlantic silverside) hypothetical protein n=1 Tax=Menidia menidia TaxID=238744 RepID=A0A8S4BJA1_9TELE|nr:unnamed protein product [Menidia menidia]
MERQNEKKSKRKPSYKSWTDVLFVVLEMNPNFLLAKPPELLQLSVFPLQLSDLLLQLLLKLFDSPHCSLLLGSDLLLHIRASVLDETDQLSEHLLTVLHCFVSRLIDGLHLLLEQIHIFLFVLESLLDLLPPSLQLSLPLSPFCCR